MKLKEALDAPAKFDSSLPEDFQEILRSLDGAHKRSTLHLEETDPPRRIAKYSVGIEGFLEPDIATGKFAVLYDPTKAKVWGGNVRVITYSETDMTAEDLYDPEYINRVWNFLNQELLRIGARSNAATITSTADHYFGDSTSYDLGVHTDNVGLETSCGIEVRASWTANDNDVAADLQAWEKLMHFISKQKYTAKPVLALL
jgi:hypothetical protein